MNKIKTVKAQAQQGDCIMRKLTAMPDGVQTVLAKGHCVLAHGEHGHSHVIEDDDAELIQIGERMLLTLTKPATVKHAEHRPIQLSPGIWEIGRVKEYDWFQHMECRVID